MNILDQARSTNMNLNQRHCIPCKEGTPPLTEVDEDRYFKELSGWELVRQGTHLIRKEVRFKKYLNGIGFVSIVGALADAEDHHPDMHVFYKKVVVELSTHDVGGLSINDFILAAKIDKLEQPVL
jgi:4a-hydroxytetrahydrobiopterin dehydratase